MKDNKNKIAVIAALVSVCMLAAGCSSSADSVDTVKSTGEVTSSQAQESDTDDASSESSASDTSSKTARGSQTINIETKETEKSDSSSGTDSTATEKTDSKKTTDTASGSTSTESKTVTPYTATSGTKLDTSDIFSNRDLTQNADTSEAKTVTVSDGQTIDITEEGVYILTGSASNCTVKVNVDSEAKVQLVLDNVSITNSDFPAIYVVSADKCFITTASGSVNALSVTGTFKADGDTNTDAVIFSKDDLVLNGLGTLNIDSAAGNGISGKDDLKITGGTYNINAYLHGIEANDSVRICDGSFTIKSSTKDGIHCENSDDDTLGWVVISGGSFDITAKSDGVQATTVLQIDGGTINISAAEGMEGTYIQINDGTINIKATDDGINAARKSTSETVCFEMNGGNVTVSMGSGDVDAIDANGNVIVSGGTINITCPTQGTAESFDYDGTATYNGGTIIVNGETLSDIPTPMMMGGGRGGMGGMGGMEGNFPQDGGFGGRGNRGGRM